MSLLNISNTYAEVAEKFSINDVNSKDYLMLFYTLDGHIITHGIDFTPDFAPGKRGLVPISGGKATEFLRGNATWAGISTTDLPIATSIANAIANGLGATTLLTTQQIKEYVDNSFSANDAMRYKGTISYSNGVYTTHTTEGDREGFPASCSVGDTYRVTTQGTYAGQTCSAGDLIICIQDGTGNNLNTSSYWTAVEANINGKVTHKVNGTPYYTYSSSTNAFTIFAPIDGGTEGQVLISNGTQAPEWYNQSALTAGSANKVKNSLSVGTGLLFNSGSSYNGENARTISLATATTTSLGGVKIDSDSTNKTISVTSAGSIYLTKQNIINALGFDPQDKNTWRPITVGGTSIGDTATLNFVPSGDIYLKADTKEDDIYDISFGISWYNISTQQYETV